MIKPNLIEHADIDNDYMCIKEAAAGHQQGNLYLIVNGSNSVFLDKQVCVNIVRELVKFYEMKEEDFI